MSGGGADSNRKTIYIASAEDVCPVCLNPMSPLAEVGPDGRKMCRCGACGTTLERMDFVFEVDPALAGEPQGKPV